MLKNALRGRSSTLVVRGEPGIGKSALLKHAVTSAEGLRVLQARGLESDSELAYATVDELIRPVLELLDRIPPVQAGALRSALALARPARSGRFAVAAATLSVLAAAAEDRPLLAVVDDAHWIDEASAEALVFAARRLEAEGVVLLFAAREEGGLLERAGLPELHLGGIGVEAARTLIGNGRRPSEEVVERLVDETGGNPLALLELSAILPETQLAGHEPLASPLPAGRRVEETYARRAGELPPEARRLLLVAAASDTEDLAVVTAAAEFLAVPAAALETAAAAGLVDVREPLLAFRHPLVRSAVYQTASPEERREAHRALAEAIGDRDPERRAWHRAQSASGPDESIAAELEHIAEAVALRGGLAASASLLERAARLSADEGRRARRLVAAAGAAWRSGSLEKPRGLLDEAEPLVRDPALDADVHELRAAILKRTGEAEEAHDLLLEASVRLETVDPTRAAKMLTQASHLFFRRDEIGPALALAERAWVLAGPETAAADLELAGTLAWARVSLGQAEDARALAVRCAEISQATGETANGPQIAWCLAWLEEYELARVLLDRIVEAHRGAGALGDLSYVLFFVADLDFRLGRLASAYASAQESVRLAEQTGRDLQVMASLTILAATETLLGLAQDARTHATHALALAGAILNVTFVARANAALGLLELTHGRPATAIAHLELVERTHARSDIAEPSVLEWMPDLVESLIRVDRPDDAAALLERFSGYADRTNRTWARAVTARYRGLLSPEDAEAYFEHALALHEETPRLFERARTELCYGEALRRSGRRAEARDHLRAALEAFERSGAVPWADRARHELGATGETVRRRDPTVAERLTPQELQVAFAVTEGRTNREVAEALFLSPKTIEYHLHNIYRKIDVRSRTELAHRLAHEGAVGEPA
jgi:DNA-binding CsgD family transcriptional regulator